ncbi:hypothetical protein PF672P2_00075 [Parabacteroides phage PF672P2]|nr:hypothetical protein PF672P2_00075 [Parabacteroides phage PF672P2]
MADEKDLERFNIPKAPKDDMSNLTEAQRMALDLFILMPSLSFYEALQMVLNKDGRSKRPADIKIAAKSLAGTMDARTYVETRYRQISRFFMGKYVSGEGVFKEERIALNDGQQARVDLSSEEFANDVLQKIKDVAYDVNDPKSFDALKMIGAKVLKDLEMGRALEPPLRVLAENCGSCRYRIFCEDETKVEDICKRCKYKEYAENNGVSFTHKDQLKISE